MSEIIFYLVESHFEDEKEWKLKYKEDEIEVLNILMNGANCIRRIWLEMKNKYPKYEKISYDGIKTIITFLIKEGKVMRR